MSYLLGIDLGTSSIKTLIADTDGNILSTAFESYPIITPQKDYAEQNPEIWWKATKNAINNVILKSGIKHSEIKSIGFSGQMHGTVLLDKKFNIIRPAIIWCDQRSKKQIKEIYNLCDEALFKKITLNPLDTGFQITSLLWIKENEKENYKKIYKVILPKDYIRFKLTGEIFTDYTDASSTLLFETAARSWSSQIISILDFDLSFFPECKESFNIAGYLTNGAELETGLLKRMPVVAGCADQTAQMLGNGVIEAGNVLIIIGTGGQVLTPTLKPLYDTDYRTNTFCNIKNWYVMGAILNGGLVLKWLKEKIIKDYSYKELDSFSIEVPPGSDGLVFLPYLIGERTPLFDTDAKGMFFGLNLRHDYKNFYKSTMESVAFAIKDCVNVLGKMNLNTENLNISGGGTNSREWVQIIADVLGKVVFTSKKIESASLGAVMLAGIGLGAFKDIYESTFLFRQKNKEYIEPIKKNIKLYEERFEIFHELYQLNKQLFKKV